MKEEVKAWLALGFVVEFKKKKPDSPTLFDWYPLSIENFAFICDKPCIFESFVYHIKPPPEP